MIRSPINGFQRGKIQWRNIFTQESSRPPVAFGKDDDYDQYDQIIVAVVDNDGDDDEHHHCDPVDDED